MLTASLVSLTPATGNANNEDFKVSLKVIKSAPGQFQLRVLAKNPTNLDVCIPYGVPSQSNVDANRNGKKLRRSLSLVSVRPIADCYVVHRQSDDTFDINLSEIYPNQPISGVNICLSVGWKYMTKATVVRDDLYHDDVCLVAP